MSQSASSPLLPAPRETPTIPVLDGMVHDMRNLLFSLLGHLELMERHVDQGSSAKLKEHLNIARHTGTRIQKMLSDVLDLERLEGGKIKIAPQRISTAELLANLHNSFGVIADLKKISLDFSLGGTDEIMVWGDGALLERVLENLLGNAIKFTPHGGSILVSVQRVSGRVVFEVCDTGRGIPIDAQERIFEKYQQVRPGDRTGGYGLGLAVVRHIIEAHGGVVQVESQLGMGSRFSFSLPDQRRAVRSPIAEARV